MSHCTLTSKNMCWEDTILNTFRDCFDGCDSWLNVHYKWCNRRAKNVSHHITSHHKLSCHIIWVGIAAVCRFSKYPQARTFVPHSVCVNAFGHLLSPSWTPAAPMRCWCDDKWTWTAHCGVPYILTLTCAWYAYETKGDHKQPQQVSEQCDNISYG